MDSGGMMALSRQRALFDRMDVIANNIANVDTVGYKTETAVFARLLSATSTGKSASSGQDMTVSRDFSQGELIPTYRDLDAAIDGKGYFVLKSPLGDRFTRNGSFQIGTDGNLVNSEGYVVQGAGGSITFDQRDSDLRIAEDGTITVKIPGTPIREERGKLSIVKFDDEKLLQKLPNGLYSSENPSIKAIPKDDFVVIHRMLEGSNVNSVRQLTEMIEVSRSVGSTSNFIKEMHDLHRKAVNIISKQN